MQCSTRMCYLASTLLLVSSCSQSAFHLEGHRVNVDSATADDLSLTAASGLGSGKVYVILSAYTNAAIDINEFSTTVGTKLQQWTENDGTNQQFTLNRLSNGNFQIQNVNSVLCVDLGPAGRPQSTVQNICNSNSRSQQWKIRGATTGFTIINVANKDCLDLDEWGAVNGTAIIAWRCNGQANQHWTFKPISASNAVATVATTPMQSLPPGSPSALSTNAAAASQLGTPGSAVSFGSWPAAVAGRTSEDYWVTVNTDPGPTSDIFWSNQFSLGNYTGYTGMQSEYTAGSPSGKLFLVSIWGATQANTGTPGSYCTAFNEGGTGYSCRYLYEWQVGSTYQFHLAAEGSGWFSVTVTEQSTGTQFKLGSIFVDASLTGVSPGLWTQWVEYWEWNQSSTACGTVPYSKVTFDAATTVDGTVYSIGTAWPQAASGCASYSQSSANGSQSTQVNGAGNSVRGQIISANQCINASGGLADGANAVLAPCGTPPAIQDQEAWVYANDNTIRGKGNFCLTASGSSVGSLVMINTCNAIGALNQEWNVTSGTITSALGSDLCLSSNASAQLVLAACNGAPTWTLPITPSP